MCARYKSDVDNKQSKTKGRNEGASIRGRKVKGAAGRLDGRDSHNISMNNGRLKHAKSQQRAGRDKVVDRQYQRTRELSEKVETLVIGRIPIRDEFWVLGNTFLQSLSGCHGQP